MKKAYWIALIAVALGGAGKAQDVKQAPSWTDKVTLKGDTRLRFDQTAAEDKDTRNRWRMRVRLELDAKVSDDLDAVIRLATSEHGNPVSQNQTMTGSGSGKEVVFNLAYLDWHPAEGLNLIGGKMNNPFIIPGGHMIWDPDLAPEGGALNYKIKTDALELMANGAGFVLQENSAADDITMVGGQIAAKIKLGDHVGLTLGASDFNYQNIDGAAVLDATASSPAKARAFGNSVNKLTDADGNVTGLTYANGFNLVEGLAKLEFDVGVPVALYADYVQNTDADDEDTGYLGGIKIGKAKDPGSFDFDYNYGKLEKNAVVGALTDDDGFGGGTDGKGHRISVGYQVTKAVQARATLYVDKTGVASGADKDFEHLQLDILAKF